METPPRPRPVPTTETEPYWEAAKRRQLLIQRCDACGRHQFYPRFLCTHCGSTQVSWVPAAGRGQVYSFMVNHRPAGPGFRGMVPYVVALIDLEEGARMMANVVECPPDAVHIGMPVEVVFEQIGEGFVLPQFRPRSGPAPA